MTTRSICFIVIGAALLLFAAIATSKTWSSLVLLRNLGRNQPTQVAADEKAYQRLHIEDEVPGTLTLDLEPQLYSIWLQGDVASLTTGDELLAEDLPPVEWTISGPQSVEVTNDAQYGDDEYRLGGMFVIQEAGEYTIESPFVASVTLNRSDR